MWTNKSTHARLKQLEEENLHLQHSVAELSLLNELAQQIGISQDTDHIIHIIVRKAIEALEAEQGDIRLIQKDTEDDYVTLFRTGSKYEVNDPFRIDDSILGWMHLNKKLLLIDNPEKNEHFPGTRFNPKIRSLLCVPLLHRGRFIGVLTVFNGLKKPVPFTEEDQRLLSIIAIQSAQIIENARLAAEEKHLLKMREELRLAELIQSSLLPKELVKIENYDIFGLSKSAQNVGGDYYDVFQINHKQLALCVGDASGKGLPAALYISNVQATLHGQAFWSPSVSSCLARVNHLLTQRTRRGFFVTLFYGSLNIEEHTLSYANAGHNRPLLCSASGHTSRLEIGDIAVGFKSDSQYRESTIPINTGDTLLIYSDGATEARNSIGEEFEEERLKKILIRSQHLSAQAICANILSEISVFSGPVHQKDDITLLVVKRTG